MKTIYLLLVRYMQSSSAAFFDTYEEAAAAQKQMSHAKHVAAEPEISGLDPEAPLFAMVWSSDYDGGGNDQHDGCIPLSELPTMPVATLKRLLDGEMIVDRDAWVRRNQRFSSETCMKMIGTARSVLEDIRAGRVKGAFSGRVRPDFPALPDVLPGEEGYDPGHPEILEPATVGADASAEAQDEDVAF